jgi:hypothetical protein
MKYGLKQAKADSVLSTSTALSASPPMYMEFGSVWPQGDHLRTKRADQCPLYRVEIQSYSLANPQPKEVRPSILEDFWMVNIIHFISIP